MAAPLPPPPPAPKAPPGEAGGGGGHPEVARLGGVTPAAAAFARFPLSPPTVSRSRPRSTPTGPALKGASLGSAGPAFPPGCHDLGELGVEGVKLLGFGSARDEGMPIAGHTPAPYPLDGA